MSTHTATDTRPLWFIANKARIQLAGADTGEAFDLVGEAPARESLLRMREDITDLRSRLHDADEAAHTLPHREKYLLLNHRLAGRVLDAYDQWLDEIERELNR